MAGWDIMLTARLQAAETVAMNFKSAETQTHLVELYTSEGCSSCPPAETWLSQLSSEPGLWKDFIPVSFHVDYWDNLGWPDKFATAAFTGRQQAYASAWKSDSVYTPCFVLDGKEWRVMFSRSLPTASKKKVGVLSVSATDNHQWNVEFQPIDQSIKNWEIAVSVVGSRFQIPVKAGENKGHNLSHDFTVLSLQRTGLHAADGKYVTALPMITQFPATPPQAALAAWVYAAGTLTPVQAAGGWLPVWPLP